MRESREGLGPRLSIRMSLSNSTVFEVFGEQQTEHWSQAKLGSQREAVAPVKAETLERPDVCGPN